MSPQFKFRVALDAVKGLQSVGVIAAAHGAHPNQVTAWKKELLEGGVSLFERKNGKNREQDQQEERTAELERTLGKVVLEKEFLAKKCKELGIEP